MKRCVLWLAALAASLSSPIAGRAAAPGSPEDVVERAVDAMNRGRIDAFVKAMHPDALEEIRAGMLEALDLAEARGQAVKVKVLEHFAGAVEDVAALRALDAAGMVKALVTAATSSPEVKEALASTKIEAVGRFAAGEDRSYVVYRSKMKFGELPIERLNVAPLIKSGKDWKLGLMGDFQAQIAALKQGLAENPDRPPIPDLKAARVEPLGHVMEGKKTAHVVYRLSMPLGDSTLSRLGVQDVSSDDPAWDAVRKDDMPAVTAFIEKKAGIVRPPTPEEAAALEEQKKARMERAQAELAKMAPKPEELAARRDEARRRMDEMRARMEKMRGGGAGAGAKAEESPLPEGLAAVPGSFFGGDRDRFRDLAPEGGVLVGVRVSYVEKFGGPKVSSVRPVYRVGSKLVDGARRGTLRGKESSAVAKEGYAVGAVNVRAGLGVDGFELIFMKVDGDRLDTSDAYASDWLGDKKGGVPREADGGGKTPVGLQGRAAREVNALGLIVKE